MKVYFILLLSLIHFIHKGEDLENSSFLGRSSRNDLHLSEGKKILFMLLTSFVELCPQPVSHLNEVLLVAG